MIHLSKFHAWRLAEEAVKSATEQGQNALWSRHGDPAGVSAFTSELAQRRRMARALFYQAMKECKERAQALDHRNFGLAANEWLARFSNQLCILRPDLDWHRAVWFGRRVWLSATALDPETVAWTVHKDVEFMHPGYEEGKPDIHAPHAGRTAERLTIVNRETDALGSA